MTPPLPQPARRPAPHRRGAVVAAGLPAAVVALLAAAAGPAAATTGSSGVGDPYFPLAGNGGYNVHHYDLTLGYDPKTRHLEGRAVITARATERLTRFDLDLKGLKVTSITVNHAKAAFRRDGQELVVSPRKPSARTRSSAPRSPTRALPGLSPIRTDPSTGGSPPMTGRSWPVSRRAP